MVKIKSKFYYGIQKYGRGTCFPLVLYSYVHTQAANSQETDLLDFINYT